MDALNLNSTALARVHKAIADGQQAKAAKAETEAKAIDRRARQRRAAKQEAAIGESLKERAVAAIIDGAEAPEPSVREVAALRKAKAELEAIGPAIAKLDADARRFEAETARAETAQQDGTFAVAAILIADECDAFKTAVADLAPRLARILAAGEIIKSLGRRNFPIPRELAGRSPVDGETLIRALLKSLPLPVRPEGFTTEAIEKAARPIIAEIHKALKPQEKT